MATTTEFMDYIVEQIQGTGRINYKKMFGEYLVYVDEKPILLVCDNMVYVKNIECIKDKMEEKQAEMGIPYKDAKEHFILDIDNADFSKEIIEILKDKIPIPKSKKKKLDETKI